MERAKNVLDWRPPIGRSSAGKSPCVAYADGAGAGQVCLGSLGGVLCLAVDVFRLTTMMSTAYAKMVMDGKKWSISPDSNKANGQKLPNVSPFCA